MAHCKVSIIIPTYRPQEYLWECLDAVKNQTFPADDCEVILVLNGCDEPYKSSITKHLQDNFHDRNTVFLHTEKSGVSNARNMALDIAQGEYIAFIDDDDYISPSYIQELYDKANNKTVSLCYPLSFIDGTDDYQPYYITQDYNKYHDLVDCRYTQAKKYFAGPVYKLIHRDIIGNRRFDVRFKNGEDSIFMFLISDRMDRVAFTSTSAVYYRRIREGSAVLKQKNIWYVFSNVVKRIMAYTGIYIKHPFAYSFTFYLTRVLGTLHGAMKQL